MAKDEYICDKRVGCVAVYKGPRRNCLSGITGWEHCIFYREGGYEPGTGWTVEESDTEEARRIADALNDWPADDAEIDAFIAKCKADVR